MASKGRRPWSGEVCFVREGYGPRRRLKFSILALPQHLGISATQLMRISQIDTGMAWSPDIDAAEQPCR